MEKIINIIRWSRAIVMRNIRSSKRYLKSESTVSISKRYGFDRGKPIDRYYIEKFIENNKEVIRGKCLEIDNDFYTVRFGGKMVSHKDVLDIIETKRANIKGDIRNLKGKIADDVYDCIILTQTLNVLDDYESSIGECYRILRPGGVLLVTMPTVSPSTSKGNSETNMWRFSVLGAKYVFGKFFNKEKLKVIGMGNMEAVKFFWMGMSIEDMNEEGLSFKNGDKALIIGIRATK